MSNSDEMFLLRKLLSQERSQQHLKLCSDTKRITNQNELKHFSSAAMNIPSGAKLTSASVFNLERILGDISETKLILKLS